MSAPLTSGYLPALYDILDFLAQVREADEDKVWGRILDKLSVAFESEAATYYSHLASKGHLLPRHAIGPNAKDLCDTPVDVRTGLCGWVATHREPLLLEDAHADARFLKEVDDVTGFRSRSVLALPLMDQHELSGVIQFFNKPSGPFNPDDLRFAQAVVRAAALALRAVKLEATVGQVTARNQSILENLTGGFMAIDTHGRLMLCNPAARRILLLPEDQKLQVPVETALVHCPKLSDVLLDTLAQRRTVKRQDLKWTYKGQERVLGYSTLLIQDPRGELTGAGVTFQDITPRGT